MNNPFRLGEIEGLRAPFSWMYFPNFIPSFDSIQGTQSKLPIFERSRTNIETIGTMIRPFDQSDGDLEFNAWRLAHAVRKAESNRSLGRLLNNISALGFLFDSYSLLDWNPDNLRLNNGMVDHYVDFSRTGRSGKIAQGLALLFMEERGMTFVSHFRSFIRRNRGSLIAKKVLKYQKQKKVASKKSKAPRTPDFIFEDRTRSKLIVESKGGFVPPGEKPNFKAELREGLGQCTGWCSALAIPKSYVVGSFLREEDDLVDEESLIVFVDPDDDFEIDPLDYPADFIQRSNYGFWLASMGYEDPADRIVSNKKKDPKRIKVPVVNIGTQDYAISIESIRPNLDLFRVDFEDICDLPFWSQRLATHQNFVGLTGLNIDVVERLSESRFRSDSGTLLQLPDYSKKTTINDSEYGVFAGSVFTDGSLVGELQIDCKKLPEFKMVEVAL